MAAHDALRTILPVVGWPEERARAVEITGGSDPILPTSFKIGETSAACLAAIGLAVSDLWELRTGRKQEAAVDARRATASLRSGHYLKIEKAQVSHERNPDMGMYPAEHGADVLKITAAHLPNLGYQEFDTGHGKLSAQLDLRDPKQLATLKDLARETDVFVQGYRPGTLGDRGLSPEELAKARPGLVYVSLCAFSHVGPWASRRGFDTVVQNVSGITWRQGELFPGKEPGPQFYPVSAIDYLTGYLMALGALVALARRAPQGGTWLVRCSPGPAGCPP